MPISYQSTQNYVSTNNSSTALVAAGDTFTGAYEDVSSHNSVVAAVKTDQDGTIYLEFSPDGTNWDSSLTYLVAAGINEVHKLTITRKYFRVRFTNTSVSAQTYFRLQVLVGDQNALSSPLNLGTQLDSDAVNVRVNDYSLQVQRGLLTSISFFDLFGRNPDTATGDAIWVVSTAYTEPATGELVNVVSSSAQDDFGGGTGAGKVTITGVNELYATVTEEVTLNGTANVSTVNKFIAIHRAYVSAKAPSGTVDGAVGTISFVSTASGTPTLTRIAIGSNSTQLAAYVVPAGYTAYVNNPTVYGQNTTANATCDMGLFRKSLNGVLRIMSNFTLVGGNSNSFSRSYGAPLVVEEKSLIMFKCIAAAGGTWDISCNLDIWLVKNS